MVTNNSPEATTLVDSPDFGLEAEMTLSPEIQAIKDEITELIKKYSQDTESPRLTEVTLDTLREKLVGSEFLLKPIQDLVNELSPGKRALILDALFKHSNKITKQSTIHTFEQLALDIDDVGLKRVLDFFADQQEDIFNSFGYMLSHMPDEIRNKFIDQIDLVNKDQAALEELQGRFNRLFSLISKMDETKQQEAHNQIAELIHPQSDIVDLAAGLKELIAKLS